MSLDDTHKKTLDLLVRIVPQADKSFPRVHPPILPAALVHLPSHPSPLY